MLMPRRCKKERGAVRLASRGRRGDSRLRTALRLRAPGKSLKFRFAGSADVYCDALATAMKWPGAKVIGFKPTLGAIYLARTYFRHDYSAIISLAAAAIAAYFTITRRQCRISLPLLLTILRLDEFASPLPAHAPRGSDARVSGWLMSCR